MNFDSGLSNFFEKKPTQKKFSDLILPHNVLVFVNELIEEQNKADILREYNLEPRHKLLFIGPPGNGKTSLASAIADALKIPLLVIKYSEVIHSRLGETARLLSKIFDAASAQPCVLFFDEFESLGKERADKHELGEMKRVVSSLLMQIDALPCTTLCIAATNHAEMLDSAVGRRFQIHIRLPDPSCRQIAEWLSYFEQKNKIDFSLTQAEFARVMSGHNFAEIEEFGTAVLRRYVLDLPDADMRAIVTAALETWKFVSGSESSKHIM